MKRRTNLALMSFGISILVLGVLVLVVHFPFHFGKIRGGYNLEGEGVLELSWYLEKGDRTEGDFTVSRGNEAVKFYIKNPFGNHVGGYEPRTVKTWWICGFTAGQDGVYSLHFENLDLSDKVIHVDIVSPYGKPWSVPVPFVVGCSMILGGLVILVYGVWERALRVQKTSGPGGI